MCQNTFDGEFIDAILSRLINNISKELIKINHSDIIIKIHEFIKLLSCIENEEKLDEYKQIIGKSKIKNFLFNIKKIYFKPQKISKFFSKMNNIFIDISGKKSDNVSMDILSMGMSDDYEEAILCGANMVRVGSSLFGKRNYF